MNCVIISAILMGFIGTALYAIELDNDTSGFATALACNVRKYTKCFIFLLGVSLIAEILDDRVSLCNIFCYIFYEDLEAL